MTPTIYLVRHGNTDLNDPSDERFRAWTDVPINHEGHQSAELAGKELKALGGAHGIVASDLQRTMLTADILAEALHTHVVPHRGLRPWDLGEFTGKSVKDHAKQVDHFQEFPDIKVPGGESYRTFYNRWTAALERMQKFVSANPDKPLVGVTHSRNLLALPSILGNKEIGDVPVKGGPPPGCIVKLTREGGEWKITEIPCHE